MIEIFFIGMAIGSIAGLFAGWDYARGVKREMHERNVDLYIELQEALRLVRKLSSTRDDHGRFMKKATK